MSENLTTIETLDKTPFKHLIMTIGEMPASYIESMTYYEMLAWICNYVEKTVIPAVNNNAEAVAEIQHWIETLDLQDEVDNKLDEMAENGELAAIIAEYLNAQAIMVFSNVSDMKSAENLVDGAFVETYGFYAQGDGGGAKYVVREVTNEDVVDEMTIISLHDLSLIAELLIEPEMSILKFGAKDYATDSSFDNTLCLQTALNKVNSLYHAGNIIIPAKKFQVKNTINLHPLVKISGVTHNSRESDDYGCILFFNPDTAISMFNFEEVASGQEYTSYYSIEHLSLHGNGIANVCLNLQTVSNSLFKDLEILYFNTGILINNCMLNTFEDINICYTRKFGVLVDNVHSSTTQTFNNVYVGQSAFGNSYPLYVCRNCINKLTFNDCTFESTKNPIQISAGNNVIFNNIYVENLSNDSENVKSVFNLGLLTDESNISTGSIDNTDAPTTYEYRGDITINNGKLIGNIVHTYSTAGKNVLNIGYQDSVKLNNLSIDNFYGIYDDLSHLRTKLEITDCTLDTFYNFQQLNPIEYGNVEVNNSYAINAGYYFNNLENYCKNNKYATELSASGWYKVATINDNSNYYAHNTLLFIETGYANNEYGAFLVSVLHTDSAGSVEVLNSINKTTCPISKVRVTKDPSDGNITHLEVYYKYNTANRVSVMTVNSEESERLFINERLSVSGGTDTTLVEKDLTA